MAIAALIELIVALIEFALGARHIRERRWFAGTCYVLLGCCAVGIFCAHGGLEELSKFEQLLVPFEVVVIESPV